MLGEDQAGILELDTTAAPGTPLLEVVDGGDVRLELDVLANRPDLFSQRGVAREVAALVGLPLQLPEELRGQLLRRLGPKLITAPRAGEGIEHS